MQMPCISHLEQVLSEDPLPETVVGELDVGDRLLVEGEECPDDGARTHATHKVKQLVDALSRGALKCAEHFQGDDAAHPTAVEAEDADAAAGQRVVVAQEVKGLTDLNMRFNYLQ